MFFRRERKSAAALSALMSQTQDTMVCFEFEDPIHPEWPAEVLSAKLRQAIIVEASKTFARYFGFKNREDLIGKNVSDLFNGDIPSWFTDYGQEVEDRNFDNNIERVVEVPVGRTVVPMKIHMQNIFSDGLLVSQWITIRDISKEAEDARRIEENERLKLLAFETVGLRTYTLNLERQNDQNKQGDMSVDNVALPAWWDAIYPEDQAMLQQSFLNFFQGKTDQMHDLFRLSRSEEEEPGWMESWTIASHRNDQGEPQGIAGVLMDRTASMALENRLAASQRLESLGVMAGGIAHDFNNLLMSITGSLDVLMRDKPELKNELKVIDDATLQAAQLCDQLLTYAGRGSGNLNDLNLSRSVRDIQELVSVALHKDAKLIVTLDESCWVSGDSSQLNQVLMNLSKNASDALEGQPGEIAIRVNEVEFEDHWRTSFHLGQRLSAGSYVSLEVEDNGLGMSDTELKKLFDPFFTTKFTGRGLGLAVVMGVVRGHAGAIRVESTQGTGTKVTVVLPKKQVNETFEKQPTETPNRKLTGSVLVVDDDPSVLQVATSLLSRLGINTQSASSGIEALEAIENSPGKFDVIMMDVTMPGMDGVETAGRILDQNPAAKIMLCSGYSNVVMSNKIFEKVTFLQKPYRLNQLENTLHTLIDS